MKQNQIIVNKIRNNFQSSSPQKYSPFISIILLFNPAEAPAAIAHFISTNTFAAAARKNIPMVVERWKTPFPLSPIQPNRQHSFSEHCELSTPGGRQPNQEDQGKKTMKQEASSSSSQFASRG